eukprot:GHVS01004151.1.p2 GENE.GHVS01004151.1~~GHVS01004151.1.p2  ORF type:complete len:131 (+),score=44.17 GHVS01004151.1:198-590(+)
MAMAVGSSDGYVTLVFFTAEELGTPLLPAAYYNRTFAVLPKLPRKSPPSGASSPLPPTSSPGTLKLSAPPPDAPLSSAPPPPTTTTTTTTAPPTTTTTTTTTPPPPAAVSQEVTHAAGAGRRVAPRLVTQ